MRFLLGPLSPPACRRVLLATLVLTLACQGHRKAATAPGPDFNAARMVATALANAYETKTGRDLPVRIAEGTWTAIPNSRLVVAMRDYATTTDIVVERSARIAPDSLTVLWFTASFRSDLHDLVLARIYNTEWGGFLFSVGARLEGGRWVIGEAEQTGEFIH